MFISADSATMCITEGKDFFIVSGNHYVKKIYLYNNHWIEYKFSYNENASEVVDRIANLVREWNPKIGFFGVLLCNYPFYLQVVCMVFAISKLCFI